MLLDGKSAVIMGSGSGVGRASALRFAEEGAKVVVADVDLDRAKETVRLVEVAGGTAIADRCDVSKEADVESTIALAVSTFGRLDIVFNNVGVPTPRPGLIFEEHTSRTSTGCSRSTPRACSWAPSTRSSSSRPRVAAA